MTRKFKRHFETLFSSFSNYIYDRPYSTLSLVFSCILFLAIQISFIRIDTTSEALLRHDDPNLIEYTKFRNEFCRPELIIVMVQSPEIFERRFLSRLEAFHREIEQTVPYLSSVTSLVNVRDFHFEKPKLIVRKFLENLGEADLQERKAKALTSRLLRNFILSDDSRATAVIIETAARVGEDNHFFGAKENIEVALAVRDLVTRYSQPGFELTLSGEPIVEEAFNRATLQDLVTSVSLALLTATGFLILLFRNSSGVLLSVAITVSTLLSTMGIMGLFDLTVKVTTIVVPAFLAAVSVAASVHILVIFFKRFNEGDDKRQAIASAMSHSGLAILMTSLTTAAGLLSFAFADLGAIAEVGYLSAAGVMLAFFYTIGLLPAALAVIPVQRSESRDRKVPSAMDSFLLWTARFSCERPYLIILTSLSALCISLVFIFDLTFSHNIIEFFPKKSKEKLNIFAIDRTMKGSLSLELVLTPPDSNPFELGNMNRIHKFSQEIEKLEVEGMSVGKVISFIDVVKEIYQAFNFNNPLYYVIPQNPDIIAYGVRQLENSPDIDFDKLIQRQSGRTRITVITTWADAMVLKGFISRVQEKFKEIFKDGSILVTTGLVALLAEAINAAIMSMVKSYTVAFIAITLMMVLVIGEIKKGLISMIPNVLPILIVMGLMGFLDVPMDINSLMIGSIAIGLVVDDTVHFMYNFQRYYNLTGDVYIAVRETLLGTGKAMLVTSLVLSSGFFILLAASLNHVVRFGVFTGLTILVALLCDFFIAPALMVVLHKQNS